MSSENTDYKDCYQVKVLATMTNELKCLYEKLGVGMFQVRAISNFDALLKTDEPLTNESNPDDLSLNPEILEVEFDKCDSDKVTFTVYVELPYLTLDDVDANEDTCPDQKVLAVEHKISTSGHIHPISIKTFTVYPLPQFCNSRGFETDCWSYEQCRVPCVPEEEVEARGRNMRQVMECVSKPLPDFAPSSSFRLTFPLSREVASLIPEFGLSGFYLKNLVSANLKTKVRLVPGNVVLTKGCGGVPAALLSYDADRCEACIEFCEDEEEQSCITQGYEYLFNIDLNKEPSSIVVPTVESMALTRRFDVKGVSKCTEKTLFSFELCFKPPLTPVPDDVTVMNYNIIGNTDGDVCYEFKSVCVDEVLPTEAPTTCPPTTTVPETTVPETTVPETTVPETTVPMSTEQP
jgi:hypothetical protein